MHHRSHRAPHLPITKRRKPDTSANVKIHGGSDHIVAHACAALPRIVTVEPMNGTDHTIADGTATTMTDGLAQRRRDAVRRCTEAATAAGRQLMFGMTTSLMLQSVPLPVACDLDTSLLHTVSSTKQRRTRKRGIPTQPHVWRALGDAEPVRINRHVYALDLTHTWAQLAPHLPFEELIALGDAIVTAIARQPARSPQSSQSPSSRGRTAAQIRDDLATFAAWLPTFRGKRACIDACRHIMAGVDSPMETRNRLALIRHGVPRPIPGYTVPGMAFANGAPMTLDMAWPEQRVAVEYDGDHHRTDKVQWRRDSEKRDRLLGHGWIIRIATGATMANADALAEHAFAVARSLMLRGAEFTFHPVAQPLR